MAGASGAIGRPLTAMLVTAGYEVVGTSRSFERAARIEASGATALVLDIFDADDVRAAISESEPDVVIHQVTDLAIEPGATLTEDQLGRNALVRQLGTRNLLHAAAAAGVRRLIAQSIAWLYLPGPEPHAEADPIVPEDSGQISVTRRGVIDLERMVTTDQTLEGIVLRYGRLYGPGTWAAHPEEPPTVHVGEAARAAALAIDHGEPGIYNIVDDGGPVSNDKARRLLAWRPR